MGRNDCNSGNDIVPRADNSEGYDVKRMSLQELEYPAKQAESRDQSFRPTVSEL